MADENLFSGEIDYFEGLAAANGDGFYYAVLDGNRERLGDWTGPFATRAAAEAAFMQRAEQILKDLIAGILGLE